MKTVLIILGLLIPMSGFSQKSGQSYYVSSSSSAIFETPTLQGKIITKLSQYNNLVIVESADSVWVKVKYNYQTGYIPKSDIKPGKAVIDTFSYRIGAVCKDGTSSSATGRGACSHHGGVSRWKTSSRESVRIVNN